MSIASGGSDTTTEGDSDNDAICGRPDGLCDRGLGTDKAAVAVSGDGPGVSPYDTAASSGTRFMIEVVAWVAGPWAAANLLGSVWYAIPAAVVLFALPALFNTPGDKAVTGIPTPGPIRIAIEMLLLVVAVAGAWTIWPIWAAIAVAMIGVALLVTGLPRYRWLAAGAPPVAT